MYPDTSKWFKGKSGDNKGKQAARHFHITNMAALNLSPVASKRSKSSFFSGSCHRAWSLVLSFLYKKTDWNLKVSWTKKQPRKKNKKNETPPNQWTWKEQKNHWQFSVGRLRLWQKHTTGFEALPVDVDETLTSAYYGDLVLPVLLASQSCQSSRVLKGGAVQGDGVSGKP